MQTYQINSITDSFVLMLGLSTKIILNLSMNQELVEALEAETLILRNTFLVLDDLLVFSSSILGLQRI